MTDTSTGTHGHDPSDEHVDVEKPEAPAAVWMVMRHGILDEYVEQPEDGFPHCYINRDALLAWLRSGPSHTLVERFVMSAVDEDNGQRAREARQ